jgi:hypothetical protein
MRGLYGAFYDRGGNITLDPSKIPQQLWPLMPYASFWGISDDVLRDTLVQEASIPAKRDLKKVVDVFESLLMDWLAGPEASDPVPTDEYVAYAALLMAADVAGSILRWVDRSK